MGYGFILLFKVGCLKNSAEKDFHFLKVLTGYESLFFFNFSADYLAKFLFIQLLLFKMK